VTVLPGSRAAEAYGAAAAVEDYYCNYGLNPRHRPLLEESGLGVTGVDDEDEVRIVELDSHPFFLATLFCFQTRSRPGRPHPLVSAFVAATER